MIFKELFEKYQIEYCDVKNNENIYVLTKLNWPYAQALEFQYEANELIYKNQDFCLYIITSHPSVLTMGRGLQRDMIEKYELVEFDATKEKELPVEVYKVKRGGGLTFHHPGQVVLYPIVHIAYKKIKTLKLINNIFELTKLSIEELTDLEELDYHRDLLGLWFQEHKLASMGIQLKRFVSLHGLALNVQRDDVMSEVLKKVSPCGIDGNNYRCLQDLTSIDKESLIELITVKLLKNHALN